MDFIIQAQCDLFGSKARSGFELGVARIGLGDLRIHSSTGDANSSMVYLLGFSDNLSFFSIYKMFALPGSVAVDVGANLGIHTLALSHCVFRGTVFSFEPRRSIYTRLIENLTENGIVNVVASDKAIGDSCGVSLLDVDEDDYNIGKARIGHQGNQIVEITMLDHALKDPPSAISLIKIDTEGYELRVLRGASCVLAEHRPVLVCEYSPSAYSLHQIQDLLPYRAYCFSIPYNLYGKIKPVRECPDYPCDILIVPEEKLTQETWDKLNSRHHDRLTISPSFAS